MEKIKPIRRLVTFSILPIFVLVVFFLHRRGSLSSISYDYFGNGGQFNLEQKRAEKDEVLPPSNNLHSQLKRLVRGEELAEFEATGFACDVTKVTEVCVINRPVIFEKRSRTLYVPSDDQNQTTIRMVKPYPRREDEFAMRIVAPVRIVMGKWSNINPTPGACQFTHSVPGLIFSYAGYLKNPFHAFNEFVIPLFLTSKHFESRVQFVFTEYRPQLASKYSRVVQQLSAFEPVVSDDGMQEEVHCFPAGAVVGLRKHDNLDIKSNEVPKGYTLASIRQFLWETYNVKVKTTLNVKRPKVLLISRTKSRAFLNEDEMVKMMEQELGFEVHRALPNETSSLDTFAPIVNSCDFMVGAHGAGLTNSLFLPNGAVMIQIVPLGLNWASDYYFGEPAPRIGLNYLRYKVWRNETSLYEIYGPDNPIVSDPASIYRIGPLAVTDAYLIKQNFRINLARFKGELLKGLKLLEQTQSIH